MSAALDETLRAAAVNTFEQMVFLLPDTPPDEQQRARKVTAVATIAFTGPASGLLQVHACEGLLPRLTENMLGNNVPLALQLDALGEIANIICGQLFPQIAPIETFEQRPPLVSCLPETPNAAPAQPAAEVQLGLEGTRADVLLYLFWSKPQGDGRG